MRGRATHRQPETSQEAQAEDEEMDGQKGRENRHKLGNIKRKWKKEDGTEDVQVSDGVN